MTIEDHKFHDHQLSVDMQFSDSCQIKFDLDSYRWFKLSRDDVIALADHFKITHEELVCQEYKHKYDKLNSAVEI